MLFGNLGFLSGLSFRNMKLTSVEIEKKLDDPNSTLEDLLVEEEPANRIIIEEPKGKYDNEAKRKKIIKNIVIRIKKSKSKIIKIFIKR